MKKKLIYGVIGLITVLAIVGFVANNSYAQSLFNRDTASIEAAEGEGDGVIPVVTTPDIVWVEAKVAPTRAAELSMATGGIVAEVLVNEGDSVTAGTPLVRLQNARQAAAVAQAEANLLNAQSNLARLQAPPRSEEIARYQAAINAAQAGVQQVLDGPTEANITSARVDLANAEAALREAQSAYDRVAWANDISMMPQATALEQATNNYVRAQANLDELLKGASAADVSGAQAQVSQAQADLQLLLAGAMTEEIAAAAANVAGAEAALADARIALADMTLIAPFDGIVAAVNVEVGEQVSPGVASIQIADLSVWKLETEDLTELDVVNVTPGAPVEISYDALPGEQFTGRIVNIRPLGENRQGDITYTAIVALDNQDPRLRWNMTADVSISTAALAAKTPGKAAPIPAVAATTMTTTTVAAPTAMPDTAPLSAENTTPGNTLVTVTVLTDGANLNVRGGPGTTYPVIASARSLSTLPVLGRNAAATWLLVELEDGRSGWVSADFTVVRGDVNTLPITPGTASAPAAPQSSTIQTMQQPVSTGPAVVATDSRTGNPATGLQGTLVLQSSSGGPIHVYNLATGDQRQLTTGLDPALSPDGQTVAFVREGGESGLYLIDLDGRNERRIYNGGEQLRAPSWSPDGASIVFSRKLGTYACRSVGSGLCFPDNEFLGDFDLVNQTETGLSMVDINGQNFRDLPALNTAVAPAWGEGGIVYASNGGIQRTGDQPGDTTQAIAPEYRYQDPAVSPDGGQIVFHSLEGNHRELFVVNADGSGLRALTRPLDLLAREFAQNVAPVWSPDGQHIAFVSNRTASGDVGDWGVWVMRADGSDLQPLPLPIGLQYNFQNEQVLSWRGENM